MKNLTETVSIPNSESGGNSRKQRQSLSMTSKTKKTDIRKIQKALRINIGAVRSLINNNNEYEPCMLAPPPTSDSLTMKKH